MLIIAIPNYGQIVINQEDMPQVGDVLTFSVGTTVVNDPAETGENLLWNYNDLTILTQETDTFVSVGDTPFLYQFFFNNGFLYPDYEADVALGIEDITIGPVAATNVYSYYKNDEDGYRVVGIGATISGLPNSIRYDPIDWVYEFPLGFGNQFEGNSYLEFSVPGIGFIAQDKYTVTEVDGWGQLILPIGTFETIRVKKIVTEVDSVYNEAIGLGFSFNQPERIIYQWLAENESAPVLEITTSLGQTLNARYKDELIQVGIDEIGNQDLTLYPNPTNSFVKVNTEQKIDRQDIEVLNTMGQIVNCSMSLDSKVITIDVGELKSGVYYLRIIQQGQPYSQRFTVQ